MSIRPAIWSDFHHLYQLARIPSPLPAGSFLYQIGGNFRNWSGLVMSISPVIWFRFPSHIPAGQNSITSASWVISLPNWLKFLQLIRFGHVHQSCHLVEISITSTSWPEFHHPCQLGHFFTKLAEIFTVDQVWSCPSVLPSGSDFHHIYQLDRIPSPLPAG